MWSSLLEIRVSLPSDGGAATRSGTRLSRETDVILTSEHALLLFWHDPSDHYVRAARTLLQSSNYFEIVWHFDFYRFKNKDLTFRQTILMHSVHKLLLINVLLITYFFKGNLSFKMLKVRVCIQDFRLKCFLISLLFLVQSDITWNCSRKGAGRTCWINSHDDELNKLRGSEQIFYPHEGRQTGFLSVWHSLVAHTCGWSVSEETSSQISLLKSSS